MAKTSALLIAVVAAAIFTVCDTRGPVQYDEPLLLELSAEDSVITFPFPVTTDGQGNPITQEYLAIRARTLNADRGLITDPVNVHFFTSHGSITGLDATEGGVAEASFFPQESIQAYYDSIWAYAAYNDSTDTVWAYLKIRVLPASAGPASKVNEITLSASPTSVQIKGTGGSEQSTITAVVKDEMSRLIADGTPVAFRILAGPGGGEVLSKDTGYTKDGIASVTFISGSKAGVVDIQASSGGIAVHKALLTITSGPPARISISTIQAPLPLEEGGNQWILYVQAKLTDANLNEVRDGWSVMFSVDTSFTYDRITPLPPETTHMSTDLEGLSINSGSVTGMRYAQDVDHVPLPSLPGVAETYIRFPVTAIFDSIRFVASTRVDSITITAAKVIGFPLPCEGCTLSIQASNVQVPDIYSKDTCMIIGTLRYGVNTRIPGARVRLAPTIGTLLSDSRVDSNGVSVTDANGEVQYRVVFSEAWRKSADRAQTADMIIISMDQPCLKPATQTISIIYGYDWN